MQDQWGFAENLTGRAVVIGEWGGNVGQKGTVVGEVGHRHHPLFTLQASQPAAGLGAPFDAWADWLTDWGLPCVRVYCGPAPHHHQWASALVSYLVQSCIADTFFWSLNPDSMDTGGLLKA